MGCCGSSTKNRDDGGMGRTLSNKDKATHGSARNGGGEKQPKPYEDPILADENADASHKPLVMVMVEAVKKTEMARLQEEVDPKSQKAEEAVRFLPKKDFQEKEPDAREVQAAPHLPQKDVQQKEPEARDVQVEAAVKPAPSFSPAPSLSPEPQTLGIQATPEGDDAIQSEGAEVSSPRAPLNEKEDAKTSVSGLLLQPPATADHDVRDCTQGQGSSRSRSRSPEKQDPDHGAPHESLSGAVDSPPAPPVASEAQEDGTPAASRNAAAEGDAAENFPPAAPITDVVAPQNATPKSGAHSAPANSARVNDEELVVSSSAAADGDAVVDVPKEVLVTRVVDRPDAAPEPGAPSAPADNTSVEGVGPAAAGQVATDGL